MQFTDCGLESATHVHMKSSLSLSVYIYIQLHLPTVEHTYVHMYSSAILT